MVPLRHSGTAKAGIQGKNLWTPGKVMPGRRERRTINNYIYGVLVKSVSD